MIEVKTSDFEIEITVDDVIVASLSSTNGLEGFVTEPDIPFRRMSAEALMDIAKFFIDAAKERVHDEISEVERSK